MPKTLGGLRHRHKKAATTTTLTHYGFYVPEGEKWFIVLVAFSADTTASANFHIGIDRGGSRHRVSSHMNMTAADWYHHQLQVWLFPHERLQFDWDGIVNGETVEASITGHVQKLRDHD